MKAAASRLARDELVEGGYEDGAVPAFPEAAWRGPFAEYRRAMEGVSEAADVVHFMMLWVAAAMRLRRRVHMQYAYPLYPNIYVTILGASADAKKTTGMRQQNGLIPQHGVKVCRGIGSGEALADWMQQPNDAPPVSHLLVIEELAALLKRAHWDGSTLLTFLTETFDAPPLYEAPFRKGSIRLVEPTPSLVAGSTPDWFWKSVHEDDIRGGALNRVFFAAAAPKAPIPRPGPPHAHHLHAVLHALDALDEIGSMEATWSPEAEVVWDTFYLAWKSLLRSGLDGLAGILARRADVYALKLAMVYAAFERTLPLLTAEQMASATLVAGYGIEVARWLVGVRRGGSRQHDCEQAVLEHLKGRPLPAWKIHKRISGRWSADELDRTLNGLLRTGVLDVVAKTSRNKPIYGRAEG